MKHTYFSNQPKFPDGLKEEDPTDEKDLGDLKPLPPRILFDDDCSCVNPNLRDPVNMHNG